MSYSKEQLMGMPISLLRGVDIQTKEEEEMVQMILNAKLAEAPIIVDMNITSSQTDDMTPEKEAILQAEIDAKRESMRREFLPPEVSQETPEPVEVIQSIAVPPEFKIDGVTKKFCQYCDAKGPISHKKNCTRLSTNNKLNEPTILV